jgi:hypothetical protein
MLTTLSRRSAASFGAYSSEESVIVATQVGDAALRIRVERMLRGEFILDDLTNLFLALRQRAGGRQSVVEVGDFVAHRNERNKGIVSQAVRDFFVRVRFLIESYERKLAVYDLPPYIAEFLQASARHMDYQAAKKNGASFTRVQVKNELPGLLASIKSSNGRCYLWPLVTQRELELCDFLASLYTFKPMLTEDSLFEEFTGALAENGLLRTSELQKLLPMKGAIALFALCHMHQCFVELSDGVKGYLEASPYGGGDDTIAVTATVPTMGSKGAKMAHAVFLTDRTVADDCRPGMECDPQNPYWKYPLEVGPDQKLRPLGG